MKNTREGGEGTQEEEGRKEEGKDEVVAEEEEAKRINVQPRRAEILLCKAKGLLVFAHLLLPWTHFPPASLKYLSSAFSLSPSLTVAVSLSFRPCLPFSPAPSILAIRTLQSSALSLPLTWNSEE